MFLRLAAGLLAPLFALAACAPESEGLAGRARVKQLELHAAGGTSAREMERTVGRIEVPEDLEGWVFKAQRHWVRHRDEPQGGPPRLLVAKLRAGKGRLRLPFPPATAPFNEVRVHVWRQAGMPLSLSLATGKQVHYRSPSLLSSRKGIHKEYVFPLPADLPSDSPADTIELIFNGEGSSEVAFEAIELAFVPWSRRLPAADAAARMVRVGLDARRAKGLSNSRPLRALWDPLPGSVLEVEFAATPAFGPLPKDARLAISAEDASGRVLEREFPLAPAAAEPGAATPGWTAVRLEAEGLRSAQPIEVRFELRTSSSDEVVCAVAEPRRLRFGRLAPTVVLITSDTHRADHLGCAPQSAPVHTPFLDQLADGGLLFTDCRSSTNITNPSHTSLLTGVEPHLTGIVTNYARLPAELGTLAEAFGEAGWASWAVVSSSQLCDEWSGLGRGFDRLNAPRFGARAADESLAVLESWLEQGSDLPLFLWLHLFDAHAPYAVPDVYREQAWSSAIDPFDPSLAAPPKRAVPSWLPEVRNLDYLRALYRAEVAYLDDCLAQFFEHPRFERAMVAVTADHGENLGEHDLWWKHRGLWPETLAVPLILNGPGIPAGVRRDDPVGNVDLGRTLLDLAGLEDTPFPGRNLVRNELTAVQPRFALSATASSAAVQVEHWFHVLELRDDPTKAESGDGVPHRTRLYHLGDDPRCEKDLAADHLDVARRLRARLVAWLCAPGSGRAETAPAGSAEAAMIEDLAALGYADQLTAASSEDWFDPECDCVDCERFGSK